jgi:hypothetical protein
VAEPDVAEQVETRARHSDWLEWAVRAGLLAYGLVGWVAIRLISAPGQGTATSEGALAQLASDPAGRWTLAALAGTFAALVLWQLIAMAVGYRDSSGWSRHLMRAGAGGRAAVYAYFGWVAGRLALRGASSGGRSPSSTTSRVLAAPAGPFLLAAVGCVVVAIGVTLVVFGWRRSFLGQLDEKARHADRRVPIVVLGQVGYVVKGLAFVVIGGLLVWAAWSQDPGKSGGLDHSFYLLLGETAGKVAVVVVGAGIACFGLYLVARARHLDPDTLTS